MKGANTKFINDPKKFLFNYVVNNVRWLQNASRNTAPFADYMKVLTTDHIKETTFDLVRSNAVNEHFPVYDLTMSDPPLDQDEPIKAYWCPYVNGNGLPGFVDVPRLNPTNRFVFTGAMNGCAFVMTDSPLGANYFRVYHHQHPDNNAVTAKIHAVTPNVIGFFGFDDYGTVQNPNAFNFLFYRNSKWLICSQPQSLQRDVVGFRPGGSEATVHDAF